MEACHLAKQEDADSPSHTVQNSCTKHVPTVVDGKPDGTEVVSFSGLVCQGPSHWGVVIRAQVACQP